MRLPSLVLCVTVLALAACGGDTSGPSRNATATRAIARFDYLADSSAAVGDSAGARIFSAAAEAVRASGDVATLPISIDGASSDFNAIAFQLNLPATTTCGEFRCQPQGPFEEHLLVAWQEDPSARVIFIAKDGPGSRSVTIDTAALDTATAPPAGLALVGEESGAAWYSTGGTASDATVSTGDACPQPREATPGAAFTCSQVTFRWSADFTATDGGGDFGGTTHRVVIAATDVPGARVDVSSMTGTLSAMAGRAPVRSRLGLRVERARSRS